MESVAYGTGTRKRATAKVWLIPGGGEITVNGMEPLKYFGRKDLVDIIKSPLLTSGLGSNFNVKAKVTGGGIAGQAGAISLGIARALIKHDPNLRPPLKSAKLLSRDSREKERMKYGLAKRRKRFQFSKR